MKNHVIANGQILQMNKKWSNLKQNQQNMITEWLQAEYQMLVYRSLPASAYQFFIVVVRLHSS
ncbi:hypothetical protein ACT4US_17925, partial [Bacillus sp. HC-Mk]